MKMTTLPSTPTAATKNDRRISFIRNASAVSHTGATPPKRHPCQEVLSS